MDKSGDEISMRRLSPPVRISIAMILGGLTGELLGPRLGWIGQAGEAVISLIKMLAAPLILFAVLDAFLRTTIKARSGRIMVGISSVNAALALEIGLTLTSALQPGRFLAIPAITGQAHEGFQGVRAVRLIDGLLSLLPSNLVDPFRTNAIVPIVFLAAMAGAALRRYKDEQISVGGREYRVFESFVSGGLRVLETMLGWVVALLPLAVFAVMARAVGTQGVAVFRGLAVYVGVVILGLALHVGLVYQGWVVFVARMPLCVFWRGVGASVANAAGAGSSLASLPVTLRSLKAMGVSDASARMSACVATNLNNDGIASQDRPFGRGARDASRRSAWPARSQGPVQGGDDGLAQADSSVQPC